MYGNEGALVGGAYQRAPKVHQIDRTSEAACRRAEAENTRGAGGQEWNSVHSLRGKEECAKCQHGHDMGKEGDERIIRHTAQYGSANEHAVSTTK